MRLGVVLLLLYVVIVKGVNGYKLRQYNHVKQFYKPIAKKSVEIGVKSNIPPAALLAIAGLESGFGDGYVSQITGNILSLGARKGEPELPAVTLPFNKRTQKVVLDTNTIKRTAKDTIVYRLRPPSLKKDYRPKPFAGTRDSLTYFLNNKELFTVAKISNIYDFCNSWISERSKVPVFKAAKQWCDSIVAADGKPAIFRTEIAEKFIEKIGGKPRSFNIRKSWVKKVKLIINLTGLAPLSKDLYISNLTFEDAWRRDD